MHAHTDAAEGHTCGQRDPREHDVVRVVRLWRRRSSGDCDRHVVLRHRLRLAVLRASAAVHASVFLWDRWTKPPDQIGQAEAHVRGTESLLQWRDAALHEAAL